MTLNVFLYPDNKLCYYYIIRIIVTQLSGVLMLTLLLAVFIFLSRKHLSTLNNAIRIFLLPNIGIFDSTLGSWSMEDLLKLGESLWICWENLGRQKHVFKRTMGFHRQTSSMILYKSEKWSRNFIQFENSVCRVEENFQKIISNSATESKCVSPCLQKSRKMVRPSKGYSKSWARCEFTRSLIFA